MLVMLVLARTSVSGILSCHLFFMATHEKMVELLGMTTVDCPGLTWRLETVQVSHGGWRLSRSHMAAGDCPGLTWRL